MTDITHLAQIVDEAARTGTSISQLSLEHEFSLEDAYEIQRASIARRLERGERRVGMKMGFTSRAKMEQMGIDQMIWGRLTDAMWVEEGASISLEGYVHPRVEPEVAFLLDAPLSGVVSIPQARRAVAAVAPAMELIDSRYKDFKFSLEDVVADNSSSSGVVIGPWCDPDVDLTNLGVVMRFDGHPVRIGSTGAILGNPWRSLVTAAKLAEDAGEPLQAGWIVLAGGATAASHLQPGSHVQADIQNLGRVSFHVR